MARHRYVIRREQDNLSVSVFLEQIFGKRARSIQGSGLVAINGRPCRNLKMKLRAGDKVVVDERTDRKPSGAPQKRPPKESPAKKEARNAQAALAADIEIGHYDDDIIVVTKPAGLTTVRHRSEIEELGNRAKRFLPPTLVDLLPHVLPTAARGRIRAVHRLDRETTGLLVLARTDEAESNLGKQFRAHSIERVYLALVRGKAKDQTIETRLVEDRGDHRRGSGENGQLAITHVHVLEELGDFTLVECRLDTGRTHQVRIHLGEQGTPLCGERVYDRPLHGAPLPDTSGATRPMLHAAVLEINHPSSNERMRFESDLPPDMQDLLNRLRRKK